jgi:hypothetical protein
LSVRESSALFPTTDDLRYSIPVQKLASRCASFLSRPNQETIQSSTKQGIEDSSKIQSADYSASTKNSPLDIAQPGPGQPGDAASRRHHIKALRRITPCVLPVEEARTIHAASHGCCEMFVAFPNSVDICRVLLSLVPDMWRIWPLPLPANSQSVML